MAEGPLRCPACQRESKRVIDSRSKATYVRRRRECACGPFTTIEVVLRPGEAVVLSRGNSAMAQVEIRPYFEHAQQVRELRRQLLTMARSLGGTRGPYRPRKAVGE